MSCCNDDYYEDEGHDFNPDGLLVGLVKRKNSSANWTLVASNQNREEGGVGFGLRPSFYRGREHAMRSQSLFPTRPFPTPPKMVPPAIGLV